MGWFAMHCGYTADEVYDLPRRVLAHLTMVADDMATSARPTPSLDEPKWSRMC